MESKTNILGYKNAYHLLRRTVFNINKSLIDQFSNKTPLEAVNILFNYNQPISTTPLLPSGKTFIPTIKNPLVDEQVITNTHSTRFWILNEFFSDTTIKSKLTIYLHNCFITHYEGYSWTSYDYLELLRFHTKDNLKNLAIRITKNIKMLYYLDNYLNNEKQPNENYAREFLELFTILKGEQISTGDYTTFTELDVQQAAKIFTGFTGNQSSRFDRLNYYNLETEIPEGYINVSAHDKSNKTFSHAFNYKVIKGGTNPESIQEELEDFVKMVFDKIETAKSYTRRLYRLFVGRKITDSIETNIITPLSKTLYDNNYNIEILLKQLLTSKHFYDEEDNQVGDNIIGALVKSPLELIIQLFSVFELKIPDYINETEQAYEFLEKHLYKDLNSCGFMFLFPVDVNGYPAYSQGPLYDKLWATANNLKPRYDNIIDKLLNGFNVIGYNIKIDSPAFVKNSGNFSNPEDSETLLSDFFELLLVKRPENERYIYFEEALLGGLSSINWKFEWRLYISSNDKSSVEIALNRLISSIVKSSEFQVM